MFKYPLWSYLKPKKTKSPLKDMKTILLPTDYSKNAWNALFTALKLFQNEDCRFLLLNTYEPNLVNVLGDQG